MVAPSRQQSCLVHLPKALDKDTSARLTIAREISSSTRLATLLDVTIQEESRLELQSEAPLPMRAVVL
jgi:hypothetical protein